MTIESMLSSLSISDKLVAMDFLWRDLTQNAADYASPEWHREVLTDRITNPAPGIRLPLAEAIEDAKERLRARRTES